MRDPDAWKAPLTATLATLPLGFVALVVAALSGTVCSGCTMAEEEDAYFDDHGAAFQGFFLPGLLVPLAMLLVCWALPRRLPFARARVVLALLAPASVLVLWWIFVGLVEWPPGGPFGQVW